MVADPGRANRVIVASALLATLATLVLGWDVAQSLSFMYLPTGLAPEAASLYRVPLLAPAIVIGVIFALLGTVILSIRGRHRAETRLQWMTHHLPGAFFAFRLPEDGAGSCESLTAGAGNLLGVSSEQILQDASVAHRLVVSEDREQVNAALAHSRVSLSPLEVDFRICKPDGETRWVRALAVPVLSAKNDVVWNGHLIDITKIKSNEQELCTANHCLEHAQSLAKLGNWACDLGTGLVTWSAQIYQLLERDPILGPPTQAEVIAMVLEGPEVIEDAFELVRKTSKHHALEVSAQRPNGSVVSLHVIVLPISDDAGNVIGMRGTVQDITEHKALEQKLVIEKEAADAASQAKGSFLATMSHEIRTPLNGMLGLLELIRRTPVNPEIRSALETVHDSGRSLQRIIDDILDFSKIEAGKLEITPEPTRLMDLINSVHWIYAGSAKSLGLDFRTHVDPDISPVLMLDALRLKQILSNFVSNAIKFTPKGSIELRVVSEGHDLNLECLRFEVVDTGIGISSEEQKKLFQEFAQAHNIANHYGGSGLGLSISRRLAELMGGNVSMSSKPGTGTTLTLRILAFAANPSLAPRLGEDAGEGGSEDAVEHQAHFPEQLTRAEPTNATRLAGHHEPAAAPSSDTLILVVDDHPVNRMVMHKQITALGYAAEDVEGGAEALEKWRTGKFSLVLTDLNMPHMSGHDLSRQIRKEEGELDGRRIPIIACSANAIPGVMQECLDAGMDDYIAKPIKLLGLSEKLDRWLPASAERIPASSTPYQAPSHSENGESEARSGTQTRHFVAKNESAITQRTLAHFREVNDVDVMHLMEAIEQGDMGTVTHLAHRIKGACGFINATGLASVSAMIEQAGRADDRLGVAWLIDVFKLELEQLNATIDA